VLKCLVILLCVSPSLATCFRWRHTCCLPRHGDFSGVISLAFMEVIPSSGRSVFSSKLHGFASREKIFFKSSQWESQISHISCNYISFDIHLQFVTFISLREVLLGVQKGRSLTITSKVPWIVEPVA